MMRMKIAGFAPFAPFAIAAFALAISGPAAATQARNGGGAGMVNGAEGIWLNPHGTVAVRTGSCGEKLCGWIVWASRAAQQDAHDSGVEKLIGLELLEDYRPGGSGKWSGTVYVPDMGHSFPSTITRLGAADLKIRGCLIGGFLCKSQIWHKIEKMPEE